MIYHGGTIEIEHYFEIGDGMSQWRNDDPFQGKGFTFID